MNLFYQIRREHNKFGFLPSCAVVDRINNDSTFPYFFESIGQNLRGRKMILESLQEGHRYVFAFKRNGLSCALTIHSSGKKFIGTCPSQLIGKERSYQYDLNSLDSVGWFEDTLIEEAYVNRSKDWVFYKSRLVF